jgi:cobalt-zinc-cadmium resistance protein CzcA
VGVDFNFSQYIQDNMEEAVSGVKARTREDLRPATWPSSSGCPGAVRKEIATVPGVRNPGGFNLLGQPNLVIKIDRGKAARYGFSVGDIQFGGAGGDRRPGGDPRSTRASGISRSPSGWRPSNRRNVDAIRSIPVALPGSDPKLPTAYIALGDLGEVRLETGASYIYRENSQRFVPLKYSVRGRDLGLHGGRRASAHRREGAAASRLQDGMDRRVRRPGRGAEAARLHRAVSACS